MNDRGGFKKSIIDLSETAAQSIGLRQRRPCHCFPSWLRGIGLFVIFEFRRVVVRRRVLIFCPARFFGYIQRIRRDNSGFIIAEHDANLNAVYFFFGSVITVRFFSQSRLSLAAMDFTVPIIFPHSSLWEILTYRVFLCHINTRRRGHHHAGCDSCGLVWQTGSGWFDRFGT